MAQISKVSRGISQNVERELSRGAQISIIHLLNSLVEEAHESGASDIHIDPTLHGVRVRLRIDGVLHDAHTFPKTIHTEVVSRIKVISGLRTDMHQSTQDGRFRHLLADATEFVDVRVSIAPTYHGENVVMRILSQQGISNTLEKLGFSAPDRQKIEKAVRKPNGMILATGPTGSGKTTTLYTLIQMLNSKDVSIITIEDPIEYAIDGVKQIQVNPHAQLTFANGLRNILRQDPNVIMVGEIRDAETAGIAVNTALTGHLLLSTLHTNDAATTLPRLLDMKIEAFLVASTVNIAIAQRLVRKICTQCREEIEIHTSLAESLSDINLQQPIDQKEILFRGRGCDACMEAGMPVDCVSTKSWSQKVKFGRQFSIKRPRATSNRLR